MSGSSSHRDCDQLELGLWKDQPWAGKSPRSLTRAFIPLFLRQKPPSHEVFFDPEQLELWPIDRPHREKSPRRAAAGASLLLEPKRRSL